MLPLLDESTQIADLLGSVNFIRGVENRLIGDNTEGRGLLEARGTVRVGAASLQGSARGTNRVATKGKDN